MKAAALLETVISVVPREIGRMQEPFDTYLGGMIRRLEVVTAMLHRPRVLFLDKPTVGLHPVARHAIWRQVEGLVPNTGRLLRSRPN